MLNNQCKFLCTSINFYLPSLRLVLVDVDVFEVACEAQKKIKYMENYIVETVSMLLNDNV